MRRGPSAGGRAYRRHAGERGLAFLSSPFSAEAFDLLERVGVSAWKVASGEAANLELLERCAESGLPVLLSTGMSRIRSGGRVAASSACTHSSRRRLRLRVTTAAQTEGMGRECIRSRGIPHLAARLSSGRCAGPHLYR